MLPTIKLFSKEKILEFTKNKRIAVISLAVLATAVIFAVTVLAFQKENEPVNKQLKVVEEKVNPTPTISVTATPTLGTGKKAKSTSTPTPTKKTERNQNNVGSNGNKDNLSNNSNSNQNNNSENEATQTPTLKPTATSVQNYGANPTSTPTLIPTNRPTTAYSPTSTPRPTATPTAAPTLTPTPVNTSKSDLVITGVRLAESPMRAGHWNFIVVDIKNQGNAKNLGMSNINANITGANGGTTGCEVGLEQLNSGQSYTTSMYCIVYDSGKARADIKVDYNNNISELDESNNSTNFEFEVTP